MHISLSPELSIGLSLGLSLALTPAVRHCARRWGVVACPRSDRWHQRPTALLGGVAIFLTVVTVCLTLVPHTSKSMVVIGASTFLFALGLVDDFLKLKPYQKLIGQVMGSALVVYSGLALPWTGSPPVNMAITIFWLVGITNAINLLDNMDGLAAGIAMIAAGFLAFNFLNVGQSADAHLLAVFAAALLGYLFYNSHPASIFMGDCGSMFIGFFLASAALLSSIPGRSRSFLPVLAVPVLTLFLPIFDTTLVMILRKLAGRAASQGGRDHTSHRLVALGMSERRAVWMLYGFAGLSGLLALLVRGMSFDASLATIIAFTLVLTFLGVHLAGVKIYNESELRAARVQPLVTFLVDISHKRRVFEVLLDVVLIVLSYYVSYALVFGPLTEGGHAGAFLRAVPVLVFVKMATFLVTGVYRGIWRYVSIDDLVVFAKAVMIGSVASVLVLRFVLDLQELSRVVFVLDGLILFVLIAGGRTAFRLFRKLLPGAPPPGGRRVLIYGAGDGGVLLLRELLNNPALHYTPVGFADDDPEKKGKVIHGLPVLGAYGSFREICTQRQVQEVLISSTKFRPERIEEIVKECAEVGVSIKRVCIQIESLNCSSV